MKVKFKMFENEQHQNDNAAIKNNVVPITKVNSMKHGWHQTINNIVCYYKTAFNISLILE